jgi:hypothetical protein
LRWIEEAVVALSIPRQLPEVRRIAAEWRSRRAAAFDDPDWATS